MSPEQAARRLGLALYNLVYEAWLLNEDQPRSEDPFPLCRAERITPWLHEDDDCWVALCMFCQEPMVVEREHAFPEPELEAKMLQTLEASAESFFGSGRLRKRFRIDTERREIPDHFHAHGRPARSLVG
ncbi:MAG: hypothetical protein ACRDG8_10620 [Actinomycetota bacterium]